MQSSSRIFRRRSTSAKEGVQFKKDNQAEHSFFTESSKETFFKPANAVTQTQSIQRKCADCEKEDKQVHRASDKKEEEKLHRMGDKKEEEKKLQKKDSGASNAGTANTSAYISSLNGKGNHLPKQTEQFFSSRMGYDFSGVKIHADKEAADSAKEVNAKAYTIGDNIVFNEGQYNTESVEGRKLLAHELVHVVQNDKENINRQPTDDLDSCKGWRSDPHSITVVAADKIMKEELKWDKITVQKITSCDIWDPDNKHWGCDFITSDKRDGRCLILPKENRLNIIIGRKDGKGSFWCFYNFTCDKKSGKITLTKDRCGGAID